MYFRLHENITALIHMYLGGKILMKNGTTLRFKGILLSIIQYLLIVIHSEACYENFQQTSLERSRWRVLAIQVRGLFNHMLLLLLLNMQLKNCSAQSEMYIKSKLIQLFKKEAAMKSMILKILLKLEKMLKVSCKL